MGSCTSHGSLTCDDVNEADDAQAEVRLEDLQDDLIPGQALPDVEVVLLETHLGSWETSTEMDSHGRSPSTFSSIINGWVFTSKLSVLFKVLVVRLEC